MPPLVCTRYPRTAARRASSAPGHCVDAIGERGQSALEAPPFLRSNAAPKACLRAPAKTFQDALEKGGVGNSGDLSCMTDNARRLAPQPWQHRPIVEAPRL